MMAQSNSVFIGASAGANFSKFKHTMDLAELYPSTSAVTGLNGGVDFGMQLGNFTLQSGIQYIQKGSIYETDNFQSENGTAFFSAKEKLHFITVPLLLGYRKQADSGVGLSFAMGPAFNIGLGGKIDETTEVFGTDDVKVENYTVRNGNSVNDDYKSTQVSFQIKPGIFFKLNDKAKLALNVTWDIGLSDMYNPRYKDANTFFDDYQGNQFSRSTILSIGYEYHFGFGDRY